MQLHGSTDVFARLCASASAAIIVFLSWRGSAVWSSYVVIVIVIEGPPHQLTHPGTPLPSDRQSPSYGDCLEFKGEYCQS